MRAWTARAPPSAGRSGWPTAPRRWRPPPRSNSTPCARSGPAPAKPTASRWRCRHGRRRATPDSRNPPDGQLMTGKHIRTELPGPRARAMLARDAEVVSPSYPRDYPFVMSHGRGTEVWDVDGNRFLDFAAGIAVCATGHAHPKVVAAIRDAAGKFVHISSDFWHEEM